MTDAVRAVVDEARALLLFEYGGRLAEVVLFGSQARGDAELGSDVNLLVVLHGWVAAAEEIAHMGRWLSDLSLRHDIVVSSAFTSEERFRTARTPFLLNVRREGVVA